MAKDGFLEIGINKEEPMKLKTVPKIRADCISCNGDSSVRIREGNNKVVPSFGISVYPLQQLFLALSVVEGLDGNTELRNDVNTNVVSGAVGVPQRKIFESKEAKVFL